MNHSTPLAAAQSFIAHQIRPIPLQAKSKIPSIADWTRFNPIELELQHYFQEGLNLGCLLGSASNHIVDVDLDWEEAGKLAPMLLPKSWTVGRGGHIRHILIKSIDAKTVSFDAPVSLGQKRRIVEILSDGKQVMMPPSIHPNGQPVEWLTPMDKKTLAEVKPETLLESVQHIAGAAVLLRLWPDLEGSRHDVTMALAGSLYHAQWPEKRIVEVLKALLSAANDSEKRDRARAILDTIEAAKAGKPVTGLPKLAEYLPADVIECLKKWWGLGEAPIVFMLNGKPFTFGDDDGLVDAAQGSNNGMPNGNVIQWPQTPQSVPGGVPWTMGSEWPELLEFESVDKADYLDYPIHALGPLMSGAVEALVYRQQTSAALAAQAILSAASATVHGHFNVVRGIDVIPISLWFVFIAGPGERKTSTEDIAFERIHLRMKEALSRYRTALKSWKAAEKPSKQCSDGEAFLDPKPRCPVWILRKGSTEGISKNLYQHWPAITLANTDAASWLGGYSMREGRDSATAATLSSLWTGTLETDVKASLEEPMIAYGRRLGLSLMIQPELAAQLFESRVLAGQGFLSRCLPAFPPSTMGTRLYRETSPDPRLETFFETQDGFLTRPPNMDLDTGELSPKQLPLDTAALNAWIAHHNHFEVGLLEEYAAVREVANKMAEQVLRLAGVRAALEGFSSVSAQHINDAAELARWYLNEWLTIPTRLAGEKREVALPKQLLEWMRKKRQETGQSVFNVRRIYQSGPRLFQSKSQITNEAMLELMRRGYVRPQNKDYELRSEEDLAEI